MDNRQIMEALLELADGLEFLEDNPFKIRAYRKAAQSVSSLDVPVAELVSRGETSRIEGVGKAIAEKIEAWVLRGDFSALEKVSSRVPRGLDELMKLSGLGTKRLRQLHEDLGIATVDELLSACRQGRLSGMRGFPEKKILRLEADIERVIGYRGKFLIDTCLEYAGEILGKLRGSGLKVVLTGECRRTLEVMTAVDLLVEETPGVREIIRTCIGEVPVDEDRDALTFASNPKVPPLRCRFASGKNFAMALFLTTGSGEHIDRMRRQASLMDVTLGEEGLFRGDRRVEIGDEQDIYRLLGAPYIPPEIREGAFEPLKGPMPALLRSEHLKGTIHNHTTFSDGKSPLRELVLKAREMGYSWIGVSDHSKSAYYAGGMDMDDLRRQQREIDELNGSLDGITVLKGIECDILPDGSLDYPDEVLETFDFVIASVHSHMDMDRKSMTGRIVRALKNPFTTILAHPTGRLLLSRDPYEVDMAVVLEEAIRHSVAVELNANPMRLDIDWRLIPGFTAAGGKIAIGPDAHSARGLLDMNYGVMMARKGLLAPDNTLNTLDLSEIRRAVKHP